MTDDDFRSGLTGVVKWFNQRQGWGFIIGPDGVDVFVHKTAISVPSSDTLADGQRVRFDAQRREKGWAACNVVPIEGPGTGPGGDGEKGLIEGMTKQAAKRPAGRGAGGAAPPVTGKAMAP